MTDGIIQESFNHFRAITRMNSYERQYINTLEREIIEKIKRNIINGQTISYTGEYIIQKLIGDNKQ